MNEKNCVTIISGTNRRKSHSFILARYILNYLQKKGTPVKLLDLEEVPLSILDNNTYTAENQIKELTEIQDNYFVGSSKFIFVVPEYNGSIPGVVKMLLDALSVRKYDESFFHKKACLIGVAAGRAGNLRGMDHLSDILNYLGVIVFPSKLPVSRVFEILDGRELINGEVVETLNQLVDDFLEF
nr:NAD(P)H-dependent oxidoreductase [Saprospiraceae bacterium]